MDAEKTQSRSARADEEDRELTIELEETFPASDPPSSTEPGGGITGPEAADEDAHFKKVSERAHAIWLDQGQVHGRDKKHWREAELEIEAEGERERSKPKT